MHQLQTPHVSFSMNRMNRPMAESLCLTWQCFLLSGATPPRSVGIMKMSSKCVVFLETPTGETA